MAFKVLSFGRNTLTDAAAVRASAALLDVSEYQIFRMGWRAWFGTPPGAGNTVLDRCFSRYMQGGAVPLWVRRFARSVLSGEPVPGCFRPHRRPANLVRGLCAGAVTAVTVSVVFFAAHHAAQPLGCLLPPCY